MKHLFLVEGDSDERALRVLAERIAGGKALPLRVDNLRGRAHLTSATEIGTYITAKHEDDPEFSTFVVIVDSHCSPAEDWQKRATDLQKKLRKALKDTPEFRIECLTVVHELESWLLADPGAIESVLGPRRPGVDLPDDPESSCKPKEDVLEAGWRYRESHHAAAIARVLDIEKTAEKCPSFRRFRSLIQSLAKGRPD